MCRFPEEWFDALVAKFRVEERKRLSSFSRSGQQQLSSDLPPR